MPQNFSLVQSSQRGWEMLKLERVDVLSEGICAMLEDAAGVVQW
jgi:hypothetical protein